MNSKTYFLAVLFSLAACTDKQKSENSTDSIKQDQSKKELSNILAIKWTELRDTTIVGFKLNFIQINQTKYDSLSNFAIQTEVPLQGFDHIVTKSKNCQLINLKNGTIDSLCDKKEESGYYENYTIKGLWGEKNQLLVSFENWEEANDFFLSLKKQFYYQMDPEYKLSPNKSLLISHTDILKFPIYSSGLMLTEILSDSLNRLFYINLDRLTITNAKWLSNDKCLLSTGVVSRELILEKNLYYLMTIKR